MSRDTYQSTPESIALENLKKTFYSGKMRPIEERKRQLRILRKAMIELQNEMEQAIYQDLYRNKNFTRLSETDACIDFLDYHLSKIEEYTRDVDKDPMLIMSPATAKLTYEPLGVVLVIGAWNYPYFTLLKPLVMCILAGNCAVVKPSEFGPNSARILQKLFNKYLEPECFQIFLGDSHVAQKLNDLPFDLICFTGSGRIGKMVAQRASKNLVPCILELGGKSPYVWDKSTSIDHAAYKLCYGKF